MACALVSPCGAVQLLKINNDANVVGDVLQEPVHSLSIRGLTLFFSSAAFFSTEVNEFASGLASQLIKGDVCLVHEQQQQLLQCLGQSKQLRITQASCAPSTPRNHPASSSSPVEVLPAAGPGMLANCSSSSSNSHEAASSCLLKRPRSRQHIAAANSTRQRILRSMSAASGASEPLSTTEAAGGGGAAGTSSLQALTGQLSTGATAGGAGASTDSRSYHHNRQTPPAKQQSGHMPATDVCSKSLVGGSSFESSSIPCPHSLHKSSGVNKRREAFECPRVSLTALQECSSSSVISELPVGLESFHLMMECDTPPEQHHAQREEQTSSSSDAARAPGQQQPCSLMPPTPHPQDAARHTAAPQGQHHQQHQVADAIMTIEEVLVSSSPAAAAVPEWSDLPVEVIALVARFAGSTVAAVMPICMTCRSWRQAVLEDDQLLLGLTFTLNTAPPRCTSTLMMHRTKLQHPVLLERAAKLGNVSALVVRARLLDAAGLSEEAMRCWRRAAKAGHLEGQLLFGLALYRGTAGVAPDPEDAHLWLSKALKQVLAAKPPGSGGCAAPTPTPPGGAGAGDTSSTNNNTADSPSSILPLGLPSACVAAAAAAASSRHSCGLHARVLTQAGLVLGYLSFDGEGTRTDKQEAVRCFKLAAQAGCKEAQQVLGWIFNTGQY